MTIEGLYSKPWRLALGYIVFSMLALALFAAPLWYGWRVNVGTLRIFVPDDMLALPDLFARDGAAAVTAALRARENASGLEVTAFAGPGKTLLAGTLRRWPTEIPDHPGTYGHVIDPGDGSAIRVVVSHVMFPDGHQLIIGRQSSGLMSLEGNFWYGMTAAMAIVMGLGAALAWLSARRARAARHSEERYALAMTAAGDGHADWNLRTGEYYISPRMRQICGDTLDATYRDYTDWMNRFPCHPDDRPAWNQAVTDHFAGRESNFKTVLRIIVNGEERWTALHFLSTRDASGTPVRWTGSIADITEQKRAEGALRESQDRYALAVAGSADGVWDVDFTVRRAFFSARARELTGLPADLETMPLEDYFDALPLHPDDRPRRMAAMQAHLSGQAPAYTGEFRIRQRDGEYRWRRIHGLCVRDAHGHPQRMAGSISDVDMRRRAEEALKLSEERYGLALDASEEGHFDVDLATDSLFFSKRMYEILGCPPETRFRTHDEFVKHCRFFDRDGDTYNDAVRAATATDGPDRYEFEFRIVWPSGDVRWLETRAKIARDAGHRAVRHTGTALDITEVKRAEEALRRLEQELLRAQRLEAIGTLAGGIAHDFNNILGAILGYGEMATRDARAGTRLRRDLDSIMAAGERGRALVDRILAFSRSAVGERVPVNVEAVVREALHQVAPSLPTDVKIVPLLHAGDAAMLGDSTQVYQVVMNLASNAVQAMPQGGVLRVALEITRIESAKPATLGTLKPGDYIVLTLSDTGIGMRHEVLERMFDPFFTTKDVGVGTGLGLSLVHGIVTSVGGAIDVVTEVGSGTMFTVYLPRSGDAPAETIDTSHPLPRGDGQCVLVVDDEEPLVRLATETLEKLGYAPVGFTSSVSALHDFGTNPGHFDAILTDERMPGVTGLTLIREVRRVDPSIPILLMTGFVSGAAAQARELGANEVLKKPLLARDLATSLARVLSAP